MKRVDFSLVLTCYNEGPTFEKSVLEIVSSLAKLKLSSEIIFVEDKSTDNTKIKVEKLLAKIKDSRAIFHKQNTGRGQAVSDGIRMSHGAICAYMDVDCEISPTYIPEFIEEIEKGADMVVAKRYYEKKISAIMRVIASWAYSTLVRLLLNIGVEDTEAGFKFFATKKILPVLFKTKDKGWFWDTEICARAHSAGLKIHQLPVLFVRRHDKKSTVRLIPDSIEYFKRIIEFKRSYE